MIFMLLVGSVKNSLILNFYLLDNRDFTELFCENKNIPETHCNGNCKISKMADHEGQNELPSIFQHLKTEIVLYAEAFHFELPEITGNIKHSYHYENNYQSIHLNLFIQPPNLV